MTSIIIVPVVFITFYWIIELFVHRRERLMIVEKLSQNQSVDLSQLDSFKNSGGIFSGLKIGCLLCGLGLGFFVALGLSIALNSYMKGHLFMFDFLSFGCILTFGGLGLIAAYLIERPKK